MTQIVEVDPQTAKTWMDREEAQLIDVREHQELMSYSIEGATHNPMSSFDFDAVPKDGIKKLVFVCAHGIRSFQVGQHLLDHNHINEAYNLTGGVAAWANTAFEGPN
jgi:rhodanese-related sulfurtransferase